MQGLTPGHPQPLALANREVLDAIVLAHHRAIAQHNFPLARRQIGIQKRLHRAVVIGQAEILTFRFLGRTQSVAGRLQTGVGLGEFAQGEHQPTQHFLG